MNGMFNPYEAARQAVAGTAAPLAQGMMAGQKEARDVQRAATKAQESRFRWTEEMKLDRDKLTVQKARDKAYADYLKAQEVKWKAEMAQGKLPAAVRTQQWVQRTLADPKSTDADRSAAQELSIALSKSDRSLPTKNFMSFVDAKLAPMKFGNQKLKEDMDPEQYSAFVSEVALAAHQLRKQNPKLSMQDSVDKAYTLSAGQLREQSWWELGADIEFKGSQGAGRTPQEQSILSWAQSRPQFKGKSDDEIIQMARNAGRL